MLRNAYFLAKIGADTAENEQHFAEICRDRDADGVIAQAGRRAVGEVRAQAVVRIAERRRLFSTDSERKGRKNGRRTESKLLKAPV